MESKGPNKHHVDLRGGGVDSYPPPRRACKQRLHALPAIAKSQQRAAALPAACLSACRQTREGSRRVEVHRAETKLGRERRLTSDQIIVESTQIAIHTLHARLPACYFRPFRPWKALTTAQSHLPAPSTVPGRLHRSAPTIAVPCPSRRLPAQRRPRRVASSQPSDRLFAPLRRLPPYEPTPRNIITTKPFPTCSGVAPGAMRLCKALASRPAARQDDDSTHPTARIRPASRSPTPGRGHCLFQGAGWKLRVGGRTAWVQYLRTSAAHLSTASISLSRCD